MKKVQIGIRIETEVAEKLKEIAKKEMRSVNNLIEIILTKYANLK